ncbi:uncharacterized protein LOC110462583 isoform X2 [Mizuhopecten yessoensis]|uniref:uncharacterized protein LOC110462583 isoform X2 n=1 Tax=Mizuhopecten yessoensis TaxID=6573 RepID=UPI000B45B20E|nr:uncharacterized protein LOC110462583 isoform X2 [Mizuhopecten yessoensis]
MSSFDALLSENSIVSPIEQSGNFFIMDSEQLVVNPFEDLQKEALDVTKKVSVTEKLVSVKNNICDNHFNIKHGLLQREVNHKMKKIHDNSSALRYEVKVFDINKRKIDLETKQRIQPEKDFTYDATQINNSEKRLGIMQDAYYLDKQQKFPLRGRTLNDLDSAPLVSKARNKLREQEQLQRAEERSRIAASTPGALSVNSQSTHVPIWRRRSSKSAPPSSYPAAPSSIASTKKTKYNKGPDHLDSKLPSIERPKKSASHVKFSLRDDFDKKSSVADRLTRSQTYASTRSVTTRRMSAWEDSDDDMDDSDFMERIDLRALLFGDKFSEASATSRPQTRESVRSVRSARRGQSQPMTQEMMIEEQKKLDKKLVQFYKLCDKKIDDESEEEEEVIIEVKPPPPKTSKFPVVANQSMANQSRATTILNIFSKPLDNSKKWKTEEELKKEERQQAADEARNNQMSRMSDRSVIPEKVKPVNKEGKEKKNLWDFIKTSMDEGKIKRAVTPSELILSQMTKLDLSNRRQSHVPLNSASRAMRHTPTFKMRRIVEGLMKNRTKFEQQEVENLKKQLEGGGGGGGSGAEGEGQMVGATA